MYYIVKRITMHTCSCCNFLWTTGKFWRCRKIQLFFSVTVNRLFLISLVLNISRPAVLKTFFSIPAHAHLQISCTNLLCSLLDPKRENPPTIIMPQLARTEDARCATPTDQCRRYLFEQPMSSNRRIESVVTWMVEHDKWTKKTVSGWLTHHRFMEWDYGILAAV